MTRPRPALVRFLSVTVIVLGASVASSCGSSGDTADGGSGATTESAAERPVTADEAALLADVLVRNHDAGGADVTAAVPFGVADIELEGEVDWTNGVGSVVAAVDVDAEDTSGRTDRRIAFTSDVVLEEVPGLAERLVEQGEPPAHWVARPLSPSTSPLDVVLSLMLAASSTARENPVLLAQDGATWIRSATVTTDAGEVDVEVFGSGRSRYHVDADGNLWRQEADVEATSSTVVIDYDDRGPRIVDVPDENDVVDLAAVQDLYDELIGD